MYEKSIKDRFKDRIINLLNKVRDELLKQHFHCNEVKFSPDEEYEYNFEVQMRSDRKCQSDIFVTLRIMESHLYDGRNLAGDVVDGYNFLFEVYQPGLGEVLYEYTPTNYTAEPWMKHWETDAAEARFSGMEYSIDIEQIIEKIQEAIDIYLNT